jgi:hypothetical protein
MVGVGVKIEDADALDGTGGGDDASDLLFVAPLAEVGNDLKERGTHYSRPYPAPRARSRWTAALMRARWVKAWGKLPKASPLGPISSA